jgi:hypothetical protein
MKYTVPGISRVGLHFFLQALFQTIGKNSRARSWKQALAPLRELERHWIGQWDSTDIIRYFRDTRYGREDRR